MRRISFGENGNLWLEYRLAKLRFNKIISKLKTVKPLEQIVDLGAGFHGRLLADTLKLFPGIKNAVGVDLSVSEKITNPKIELIQADLNKVLPLADESFDAAICSAVLEHLADSQFVLKEIFRILKSGGSFILTTPSRRTKKLLEFLSLKLGWLETREITDHEYYFTKADLEKILKQAGFKEIKIKFFQFGFNILAVCKK